MKKTLISVSLLLTLAACQGDEPKSSDRTAISPPASVTAQSDSTKTVPEQVVAEVKESATQMAEKAEAVMKDAEMQKEKAEAIAKAEVVKVQQQVSSVPVVKEAMPVAAKPVAAVTAAVTSGDAENGKVLARKCAMCHNFDTKNKVGPGLAGVYKRQAGSVAGFKYQFTDFIQAGKAWRWDEAHLVAWVCDAKKAVKDFTGDASAKTKMGVQRICDTSKQADIIAYLKTL